MSTAPPPTAPPEDLEALEAQEVVAHVAERFAGGLVLACSFQKESSVLLDLVMGVDPSVRVITLDTGFLFPETYETWRRVEEHYGIEIETHQGLSPARQAALHGEALWSRDPDACCGLRKVTPLREALAGAEAWITGLRREQSASRAGTQKLGWDAKHGLWKVAPLADWSEKDVWRYLAAHDVPYHPLHDRGYASIGCTHCTRPGAGREGRWAGTGKLECGLHG